MQNRNAKRLLSMMLSVALALSLCPAGLAEEAGEETEPAEKPAVVIQTAEDLAALSKDCSLDTWSQGRTVTLAADIDVSGVEFSPIPTFGGTFDGQGHTVSGLHITADGSAAGLFRYVQESGVVMGLCVRGVVVPGGEPAQVGGIAGVNRGRIADCVFEGTVRGEEQIGGIAGFNDISGEIAGCRASGHVTGTSATGGITGGNQGIVRKCRSDAMVNTADPDTTRSLQDIASSVSTAVLSETAEEDDVRGSHTDTGGIAGLNEGVIQSCVNTGVVGYPHVGYNVGGVTGRQNGYMEGCTNQGTIYGRKDVGGVVGQAEPDIVLRTDEDALENLRKELTRLDSLVTKAVNNADAQGDTVSARLASVGAYTGAARDNTRTLLNHVADFADGNLHEINSFSTAVTAALDHVDTALGELTGISEEISRLCDEWSRALEDGEADGSIPPEEADSLRGDIQRLREAGDSIEAACNAMRAAIRKLQDTVTVTNPEDDPTAVKDALKDLSDAAHALSSAIAEAAPALSNILKALRDGDLPDEDSADVDALTAALDAMGEASRVAADALKVLSENTQFDWDNLQDSLRGLDDAFAALADASEAFSAASRALAQGAADTLSDLSGRFTRTFRAVSSAVQTLRTQGPVKLTPLGGEVRTAGDQLYGSLSGLSGEMTSLRQEVDGARGSLSGDVLAISRQFTVVTNCLVDLVTDVQGFEWDGLITDISDEDIESARLGKMEQCVNVGAVDGDRNVGGVVGAMAIEYDRDPEDDETRFSLGNTYETRAILMNCTNRGTVTAKKDCVGGLVGRMDLGAAVSCENYGDVSSTSGRYVGGVAGWSDSVIRACAAKCVLTGESDVGGIAGWAKRMQDCRAISVVDGGAARLGAIAGDADLENGLIQGNRFVDTGWAGVDGVSYEGTAEPVSYETMAADESVPRALVTFALTLRADGTVVETIPLTYGQALDTVTLPAAPEKEGCFGRWPDFPTPTVCTDITLDAVYAPWIEMLASEETGENKQPLALAQGRFSDEAALHISSGTVPLPDGMENGDVREIRLMGTAVSDTDAVPLRLLNTADGKAVWQYRDGAWYKVDSVKNGRYWMMTMTGTSATFCIVPGGSVPVWVWAASGAAALALCAAIALFLRRRHKKKHAAKEHAAAKQ